MTLVFTKQQLSEISKNPVAQCPRNWIVLEYLYSDGSGVAGAQFVVSDNSSSFTAQGTLDQAGQARVELPINTSQVQFYFDKDPQILQILIKPTPHNITPVPGWLERITNSLLEFGSWVWGALQGDFNEDATLGQIIVNTIITMIPVVDQIADIRDLAANLKILIWEKRYTEYAPWVAIVLTLIGLIPTLGSLLKGICKAIWHGAKKITPEELLKIFNFFAKGNGVKWLKQLHSSGLDQAGNQCAAKLKEILGSLKDNLNYIKSKIPKAKLFGLSGLSDKIRQTVDTIDAVIKQADNMIQKVINDIKQKLKEILDRLSHNEQTGAPKQKNGVQQEAKEPKDPNESRQPKPRPAKNINDLNTRQEIHKKGTNEYKTRSNSPKGPPTAWKDTKEADKLTLEAYEKGTVTKTFPDGSPEEIKWDARKAVGEGGEQQITVKLKQNGTLHGFPSGPKADP